MLRAALRDCAPGLRVAGAREPLAVFTARPGGAELKARLAELGLCAHMRAPSLLILPTRSLACALAARGKCWACGRACRGECPGCAAAELPELMAACPEPRCGHDPRAFMRELSALERGFDAADMGRIARGLRLIEGPCDDVQRRNYAREVHRAAALALRTGAPGDALRACAYIMAIGGIAI